MNDGSRAMQLIARGDVTGSSQPEAARTSGSWLCSGCSSPLQLSRCPKVVIQRLLYLLVRLHLEFQRQQALRLRRIPLYANPAPED